MRGRWASAALGAGMARRRMGYEMDEQGQAYEAPNTRTAKANRSITTTKTTSPTTAGRPRSEVEKIWRSQTTRNIN